MKFFNTKLLAVFLISFSLVGNVFALEQGTLQVTGITPTQTLAIPNGNFDDGWQWIFNITIPNNETVLRMKFANWTSGTTTIPTATNVRFWSPQSSDANSTTTAKTLSSANVYSDTIKIDSTFDLSPSTLGRQIQVVVDVRVPSGTTGGSYASSYGVSTDIDPNQVTGVVSYNIDPTYSNISFNGNASQQIIGQVLVTAQNEDVKLNTLRLDPKFISSTTPTFSGLTNIGIFLNGTQIGNSKDWLLVDAPNPLIFNFDNDVILPANQQKTITVKSNINFLDSTSVSTGTLLTVIGGLTNNAQGITTNKLISVFAVPFSSGTSTLTNYPALSDATLSVAQGFQSSVKAPNATQVKIGSFTVSTGNSESITINTIKINLSGSAISGNQISNLTIKDGGTTIATPIGSPVSGINNFSTNLSINSNSSKTIDVYADSGSSSSNLNISTSMSLTIRGNISNFVKDINEVSGPTTTFAVSTISANEISYNLGLSPATQFIVGNQSNFSAGTYNFKVSNGIGGAVIKDLTFRFPSNAVSSISANGKSTAVVNNEATIYDVGVTVPGDSSGINIPISLSIPCVGISNGCNTNSPLTTKATLIGVTYNDGVSVKTIVGVTNPTNEFYVVGSKPTLVVNSTQQTGLVIGAENKIGEVTVASDASGQIKVNKITFNVNSSGINSATINSSRIADGNTTITDSSCVRAGSLPEFVECSFTNGFIIPAGSSKTFSLYSTVTGSIVAGVVNSISTSVSSSGFEWVDTLGGNSSFSGVQIYNFPTNSYSKRQ